VRALLLSIVPNSSGKFKNDVTHYGVERFEIAYSKRQLKW
jgi:hypothetical protein